MALIRQFQGITIDDYAKDGGLEDPLRPFVFRK